MLTIVFATSGARTLDLRYIRPVRYQLRQWCCYIVKIHIAQCGDRTHDLRIMRPTRCQLRQSCISYVIRMLYAYHTYHTQNIFWRDLNPKSLRMIKNIRVYHNSVHISMIVTIEQNIIRYVMPGVGFEPTHPKITELKSAALDHSAIQAYFVICVI